MTRALMLQGTGSDVGKSLISAGLCRLFSRQGLTVRPFKPQNMSNNAAVTEDGGEIGRAQALQARACGVAPHSDMNPVLLKPQSESGAQVVVCGRVMGTATARDYYALKPSLLDQVLAAFERIAVGADLVLVEGAGSAAEVNLRQADIANMGFAEAADVPVVLIADIDRGGVLASLVGVHALLSQSEQDRLAGYIINRFRGDPGLFDPAIEIISERTGMPCLGVVPWFDAASRLPREDSMSLESKQTSQGGLKIAVPRFSRISNVDDLDPLIAEPDVSLCLIEAGSPLPGDADLVLLIGTKSSLADLAFLRAQGWDIDIRAHLRRGGALVGLCGGYQMLGTRLSDPEGLEGPAGSVEGLALLDIETTITQQKRLRLVEGREPESGAELRGYEMHMGRTTGPGLARPWLELTPDRAHGAQSADGRIKGCYLHGLFASDSFRHAFLNSIKPGNRAQAAFEDSIDRVLDGLANHLEDHLDLEALRKAAGLP